MCKVKIPPNFYFSTFHSDKKCSYHPEGSCFKLEKLSPDGLCLEAFNALYAFCFSFLHIPQSKDIFIRCPNPREGVMFRVYRRPTNWIRRIKNIAAYFINLFYPIDIIRYRIFIEVLNKSSGCPCKYRGGETFEFNLGEKRDEACPAAFNSIFPSLFPQLSANNSPVTKVITACPDHRVNVQLRLENQELRHGPASASSLIDCMPEQGVIIQVTEASLECPMQHAKGQEYSISNILDALGVRCLSAFHILFPYYLILLKGGKMPGYYARNKYAAFFQCPSIKNKVEMMIQKDKKSNNCFLSITKQMQNCPKGLCTNEKLTLNSENRPFCLYMLHTMAPYVNTLKLNESNENITINCPSCDNNKVIFKLIKRRVDLD